MLLHGLLIVVALTVRQVDAFSVGLAGGSATRRVMKGTRCRRMSSQSNPHEDADSSNNQEESPSSSSSSSTSLPETIDVIQQRSATVKIDDGGSDLTDRFKYKVQALMGNFDPSDASQDTEENAGNILSAMMNFPAEYTFHVVGKPTTATTTGDDATDAFVRAVQTRVREGSRHHDDDDDVPLETTVIPRGTRFVKVSVSVTVKSGETISEIYEALGALPECVMQF